MDLFALLFLTSVTVVFMQTCREFQVREITHANTYADKHQISCFLDLSLEQCALECLLVTICTSINLAFITRHNRFMCELLVDEEDDGFKHENMSSYVDIRDWPQDVAGTCASRPCADNQRCIPTNPYRCKDIDCGIPTVLPYYDTDINMSVNWTDTTIGSRADYTCRASNKRTAVVSGSYRCYYRTMRICNSDSSWMDQGIYCEDDPYQ